MNENAKRQRCTNFSLEEKINCLNIIKKYKHVIENKETGTRSWKEKESAWKEVTKEFNSCSSVYRSVDTLKRFYNNKKKEIRKQATQQKSLLTGTGGGQMIKFPEDPVFNLTMDLINKKTVFGLANKYDDDSGHDVHECPINNEEIEISGSISLQDSTPTTSTKAERNHMENNYEPEGHGVEEQISVDQIEVEDADMIMLEMRSSSQDVMNNFHEEEAHNWDSYCVRNLKKPVAKALKRKNTQNTDKNTEWQSRRRPQLTNSSSIAGHYEEVARLKKEVFRAQLTILRKQEAEAEEKTAWEKRQREIKEKRETEEYDLKRKILLLDIKIKEEQLTILQNAKQ